MKFRLARHTTELKPIIDFYSKILGFQVLGSFQDHDGYNGVFLGLPSLDWHLEFTISGNSPNHYADPDDLLVFYLSDESEQHDIYQKCLENDVTIGTSKNPFWNQNGFLIIDPDGFGVVVSCLKL